MKISLDLKDNVDPSEMMHSVVSHCGLPLWDLFCGALVYVHSIFAINLMWKR